MKFLVCLEVRKQPSHAVEILIPSTRPENQARHRSLSMEQPSSTLLDSDIASNVLINMYRFVFSTNQVTSWTEKRLVGWQLPYVTGLVLLYVVIPSGAQCFINNRFQVIISHNTEFVNALCKYLSF